RAALPTRPQPQSRRLASTICRRARSRIRQPISTLDWISRCEGLRRVARIEAQRNPGSACQYRNVVPGFSPSLNRATAVLQRLRDGCGRVGIAPDRRIGPVAPIAWTIEGVHPDAVELAHFVHPPRMHPAGVVVGCLTDIVEPEIAVQRVASDVLGALPGSRFVDALRAAV